MERPVVRTEYGAVEGVCRGNYDAYFGIPYAKPPVGERICEGFPRRS